MNNPVRSSLQHVGKAAFFATWPLLYMYFLRGSRTRVIICVGDDVLCVRSWYGDGTWVLPGGGLHHNERSEDGALREVYEETGVAITPNKLKYIDSLRTSRGFVFRFDVYACQLASRPQPSRAGHEITEMAWMPWRDLLAGSRLEQSSRQALEVWSRS